MSTGRNEIRRGAHPSEQSRRKKPRRQAHYQSNKRAEQYRLRACHRSSGRILLTDATCHHGGGGHAYPDRDRKHEGQHRLSESDSCDGIGAKASYPEHVDDREQRFHQHLEHHRRGKQKYGPADGTLSEVLACAAHGFPEGLPKSCTWLCYGSGSHKKRLLSAQKKTKDSKSYPGAVLIEKERG